MRYIIFTLLVAMLPSFTAASPESWANEWPETDFENTSIEDWVEVMSGGPPKDGIPALDAPQFVPIADKRKLGEREPVITVVFDKEQARAYPLRYLMRHEIVNDNVGGAPIAVTFCPLCNSAMTFDRRVGDQILSFGVSGKLRNSDMIMYDRETQSWWQQATGQGIVGDMNGQALRQLPTWIDSWSAFKAAYPDGIVMAEPPFRRAYGFNPYTKYDSSQRPFLYSGAPPPHGIAPLARVIRVSDRAWPLTRLADEGEITQAGITLSWTRGQASALDTELISRGREIGSIRVRNSQGQDLPHDVMFAFAFDAFWPNGQWMLTK